MIVNALAIAREYLPEYSDELLGYIIWEETGWPCFWHGEPLDSFRLQLAKVACREFFGEYGYFDSEKDMRLAFELDSAALAVGPVLPPEESLKQKEVIGDAGEGAAR